jgi:hypothetical protein
MTSVKKPRNITDPALISASVSAVSNSTIKFGTQSETVGFFGAEAQVAEHVSERTLDFHNLPANLFSGAASLEKLAHVGRPVRGQLWAVFRVFFSDT